MSKMPATSPLALLYVSHPQLRSHSREANPFLPQYILSRMPKAMSKSDSKSGPLPGQERSITVTLKSLRNPPLDIKLTSQPLTTSLHDIKTVVSQRARIPSEKLKILHNKRPLQDSKALKDIVGDEEKTVEFAVMVIGGAAAVLPAERAGSATPAIETEAFWSDLNGFLMQRLKDEALGKELSALFRSSWESKNSKP